MTLLVTVNARCVHREKLIDNYSGASGSLIWNLLQVSPVTKLLYTLLIGN